MALNKDADREETLLLRTNPHPVPFLAEEQQPRAASRAARRVSRPRKALQPRQQQFTQVTSPIPSSGQGAVGVGKCGITMQQAIDLKDYEEQRKRLLACCLEEDDRMYE